MKQRKYGVYHHGELKFFVNKDLLKKQKVLHNLKKIKELHVYALGITELMIQMNPISDEEDLRTCDEELTEIEFKLQELQGFKRDVIYHQFWRRPHCRCPFLDNCERYPTENSIVNGNCPLHAPKTPVKSDLSDFIENMKFIHRVPFYKEKTFYGMLLAFIIFFVLFFGLAYLQPQLKKAIENISFNDRDTIYLKLVKGKWVEYDGR